jgi:hypothetical protein
LFRLGELKSADNGLGVAALDVEAELLLRVRDKSFVVERLVFVGVLGFGWCIGQYVCKYPGICAVIHLLGDWVGCSG